MVDGSNQEKPMHICGGVTVSYRVTISSINLKKVNSQKELSEKGKLLTKNESQAHKYG